MVLVEEAWNAYPHCVTVITNGYLAKGKFYISIESIHLADNGTTENALQMDDKELKARKVEYIDIAERNPKQVLNDEYDASVVRLSLKSFP